MSLGIFVAVVFVWAVSCSAYWLYRGVAPRKYNAYAAGRLDTVYVIFMASTFALAVLAAVLLVENNV